MVLFISKHELRAGVERSLLESTTAASCLLTFFSSCGGDIFKVEFKNAENKSSKMKVCSLIIWVKHEVIWLFKVNSPLILLLVFLTFSHLEWREKTALRQWARNEPHATLYRWKDTLKLYGQNGWVSVDLKADKHVSFATSLLYIFGSWHIYIHDIADGSSI